MTLSVAACQIAADVERPSLSATEDAIRSSVAQGAELVVLPELAASGYVFASRQELLATAEPLDGPTVQLLRALSSELRCVIVCGLPERASAEEVYNSAVLVEDGQLRACYRKVHLWDREKELFTAGDQPPVPVTTRLGRIAMMICYDVEFPEWVRLAAEAGAEIIAAPCNWPWVERPSDERPLELLKVQAFAGAYRVPIVIADRCGPERGVDWIGGSAICASTGYLLAGPATAAGEQARQSILIAKLDLAASSDKSLGSLNDALDDRRPDLYELAGET